MALQPGQRDQKAASLVRGGASLRCSAPKMATCAKMRSTTHATSTGGSVRPSLANQRRRGNSAPESPGLQDSVIDRRRPSMHDFQRHAVVTQPSPVGFGRLGRPLKSADLSCLRARHTPHSILVLITRSGCMSHDTLCWLVLAVRDALTSMTCLQCPSEHHFPVIFERSDSISEWLQMKPIFF